MFITHSNTIMKSNSREDLAVKSSIKKHQTTHMPVDDNMSIFSVSRLCVEIVFAVDCRFHNIRMEVKYSYPLI